MFFKKPKAIPLTAEQILELENIAFNLDKLPKKLRKKFVKTFVSSCLFHGRWINKKFSRQAHPTPEILPEVDDEMVREVQSLKATKLKLLALHWHLIVLILLFNAMLLAFVLFTNISSLMTLPLQIALQTYLMMVIITRSNSNAIKLAMQLRRYPFLRMSPELESLITEATTAIKSPRVPISVAKNSGSNNHSPVAVPSTPLKTPAHSSNASERFNT